MDHAQSQPSNMSAHTGGSRQVGLLVLGDILAFLVFAALGRRSHGEAAGLMAFVEVVKTAAPFMLGWFLVAPFVGAYRLVSKQAKALFVPRTMLQRSALAWLAAWPLGLALRALFLQRGIPISFAIVTLLTNTVLVVGWRLVFALIVSRRANDPTTAANET